MNKNTKIIIGVVVAVIVLGGIYLLISIGNNEMGINEQMKQETVEGENSMMENDTIGAESMTEKNEVNKIDQGETMMKTGSYEVYSPEKVIIASSTHNVVLFFRASWCPSCRALDTDIKANLSKIPSNLSILDVNYDDSTSLKQKYGVTYQHTFVQVDKDRNLIKKWSGSPTLSALVLEIK